MFYSVLSVYSYLCCIEPSTSPFFFFFLFKSWNSSDPKDKFSFYAFIMNKKVLLYLYFVKVSSAGNKQTKNKQTNQQNPC